MYQAICAIFVGLKYVTRLGYDNFVIGVRKQTRPRVMSHTCIDDYSSLPEGEFPGSPLNNNVLQEQ